MSRRFLVHSLSVRDIRNLVLYRVRITDGYSTDDIRLVWAKGAENSTDVDEEVKNLPTFELIAYWGSATTASLSTGNYSRLRCTFRFDRNIGFYWIQIYQPSIMVVIISWVAFWINRDSAPARVTLGIMTVLTMTTLMTTTNRQMPKVSYIKAVDIYLGACYVMVFAALLEYAAVSYSNKKMQDRKKQKQSAQAAAATATTTLSHTPAAASLSSPMTYQQPTTTAFGGAFAAADDTRLRSPYWSDRSPQPDLVDQTNVSRSRVVISSEPPLRLGPPTSHAPLRSRFNFSQVKRFFVQEKHTNNNVIPSVSSSDKKLQMVASGIDKYSRALFPLFFGTFNLIYWTVFLKQSGKI